MGVQILMNLWIIYGDYIIWIILYIKIRYNLVSNPLHQCSIAISSLIVVLFMNYIELGHRYISCLIILKFQNKKKETQCCNIPITEFLCYE